MVVAIGEIVRNGFLFDVKNWTAEMDDATDFFQTIERLFDTLTDRKIDYLLVGGVALLSYVEGRNTQDIDLILSTSDLKALPEMVISQENKDFIRGTWGKLQIDVLLAQNPLFDRIRQQFATTRRFGERSVRCTTVEGLVILKFYALPSLYRQGQFNRVSIYENDILLLLLNYSLDLEEVFEVLSKALLPSDLEEVKRIALEIESRVKRFSTRKQKLDQE